MGEVLPSATLLAFCTRLSPLARQEPSPSVQSSQEPAASSAPSEGERRFLWVLLLLCVLPLCRRLAFSPEN